MYDTRRKKLCNLQHLRNPFMLKLGLKLKSHCLVTLVSKGEVNVWHRRLGHASIDALGKLGFSADLDDCDIILWGKLKHSKFSRRKPCPLWDIPRSELDLEFFIALWQSFYHCSHGSLNSEIRLQKAFQISLLTLSTALFLKGIGCCVLQTQSDPTGQDTRRKYTDWAILWPHRAKLMANRGSGSTRGFKLVLVDVFPHSKGLRVVIRRDSSV